MNNSAYDHYSKTISYSNKDYSFYAYLSESPLMALQELIGDYVNDTQVAIEKITFKEKSIWILDNIYVSENMRGYGVGKNLMSMFLEKAPEHSKEIYLMADLTVINYFDLHVFYEKFGFEIIHKYNNYSLMRKVIA